MLINWVDVEFSSQFRNERMAKCLHPCTMVPAQEAERDGAKGQGYTTQLETVHACVTY